MRRIQGTHREPFFPRPPPTFSGPTRRDPCPPFPYIYIFTDRQTDGHARPYTILGTQPPPLPCPPPCLFLSFLPISLCWKKKERERERKIFSFRLRLRPRSVCRTAPFSFSFPVSLLVSLLLVPSFPTHTHYTHVSRGLVPLYFSPPRPCMNGRALTSPPPPRPLPALIWCCLTELAVSLRRKRKKK